jgi:hypothetical protein
MPCNRNRHCNCFWIRIERMRQIERIVPVAGNAPHRHAPGRTICLGTAARTGLSWRPERRFQKILLVSWRRELSRHQNRSVQSVLSSVPIRIPIVPTRRGTLRSPRRYHAVRSSTRRASRPVSSPARQSHQPCRNQSVVCCAPPWKSQTIIPSSRTQRKYSREYEAAQ